MKIANRSTPRLPSAQRRAYIRAVNARLRAYFQVLTATAPPRDYANLLAQAFSGHERYRPDSVNEDDADEANEKA
jgi:hypothetical protein